MRTDRHELMEKRGCPVHEGGRRYAYQQLSSHSLMFIEAPKW